MVGLFFDAAIVCNNQVYINTAKLFATLFATCVAKRNGNNNTWAKYVLGKRGHLNGFCLSLQMTGVLDFTSRERTETQCR